MLPIAREFFESQRYETGLKNSYIFLKQDGKHYANNSLFYNTYRETLEKIDIEKRSLHNTRHTFASMMLNNGIEPLWVSNTLGHRDLSITLQVYAKYVPKKEKMVIGFLEKRYKNGTNGI
ncbi:tyrosine-type recombinase/integrase [Sulfurimonas sp.]